MTDQSTTATVSAAEQIMTAAGWRREASGGNLECWRKDHDGGEFSLITADGNCDADPLEIVWNCGRYRIDGADVAVRHDPHHTSLARALERVATLTVPDEVETAAEVRARVEATDILKATTVKGFEYPAGLRADRD